MVFRLAAPFESLGFLGGTLYAIDRVLNRLSRHARLRHFDLMVQPVPDGPLLPERLSRRYTMRELHEGDPDLEFAPRPPEVLTRRFSQGATCLGLFRKTAFVGYAWIQRGTYPEDEARCDWVLNDAASVFDFDVYIAPEHRGGVAFAALWNETNRHLRERGVRESFSRVDRANTGSRRAHARLGARPVGSAVFLQLGQVEVMFASLSPFFYISVSPGRRHALRLKTG